MAIQLECPGCSTTLRVPETAAGKHIRCPRCQAVVKVDTSEVPGPVSRERLATSHNRPQPPQEDDETAATTRQRRIAERRSRQGSFENPTKSSARGDEDQTDTDFVSRSPKTGLIIAAVAMGVIVFSGIIAFVAFRMGAAGAIASVQPNGETSVGPFIADGPLVESPAAPATNDGSKNGSVDSPLDAPARIARNDQPHVANDPPATTTPPAAASAKPASAAASATTTTPLPVITPSAITPPVAPTITLPENAASEVSFSPLMLDEPATSFTLTEDGRYGLFTHQAASLVSVYDIISDKIVTQISTTTPRSVISRGDQVFVANYDEGRISVYSMSSGWTLTQELSIPKKRIMHMSAANGSAFGGEILVTCQEKSEDGNLTNSFIYRVDTSKDRSDLVGKHPLASVSADGRVVLTQASFNQSPSGGIDAFSYEDFVGGDPTKIYSGGISQTPYVYQPYPGGLWFAENMVFGGTPIAQTHKDLRQIVIPDALQKVAYTCDADMFEALRVNSSMTPLSGKTRRVILPAPQKKEPSRLFHQLYRHRDYLLDRPWAVTHGNALFVLLMDQKDGTILIARTAAFETPPAPAAAASVNPPAASNQNSAGAGNSDVKMSASEAATGEADAASRETVPSATLPSNTSSVPASAGGDVAGTVNNGKPSKTDLLGEWPSLIAAGKTFQFPFPVSDSLKIELQSGPRGMKLDEAGVLQWSPKEADAGSHDLKFRILENAVPRFERPNLEVVSESLAQAVNGDLKKINDFETLDLDIDTLAICNGYHDEDTLLLQGNNLRVLGNGDLSDVTKKTLPARYHDIAQRGNRLIAISSKPAFLDVIDARSMNILKHYELKFTELEILEITDLASHPTQNISYLCVRYSHELPRYTVVVINEETGQAVESGVFGTWAEVSPDGSKLFTGYRDLYERGVRFHINPDWRLVEIPQYGNVDMLLAWDITGKQPKMENVIRNAGGNGQGIRLSPYADRIVYLSHGGNKAGNMEGLTADDFSAVPVEYPTKDRCRCTDAAFHPTLPWIAFPGEQQISLFDSNTGAVIEHRILATPKGLGTDPIERLVFSRDGKSLLLVRGGGESGRYLQQVPLAVNSKELRPSKPRAKPKKADPVETGPIFLQAGKLDVLSSRASTKLMSTEEIAKEYLDSVTIVLSGNSAGTGFVVGDEGYILTCEHVVDATAQTTVHFRSKTGDESFVSLPAEVIRIDEKQDIALLRCSPNERLKSVRFRTKDTIETGEAITVIGNPGAGTTLLSHTMTNGIVSNPLRIIEGVPHIQLSAAVNPGNSGGPLFDKFGNVAGLIALKANIEGASFAVPTEKLREFLESVTRK